MAIIDDGFRASMVNEKCDIVIKNAKFINVFTEEIDEGDIGIIGDTIIGIGEYQGIIEIDGMDKLVSPGFIDCHVHIESAMVTPETYGTVALKRGVTTVVADPHEIANVLGKDGIKFMMENSKLTPLDIYYMMPSCVPAIAFEENYDELLSEDLKEFLECESVLGLGEVMNVPSVIYLEENMRSKLLTFKNKKIDGHAPLITGKELNQYILSGISTDHECSTTMEALEKVKKGMYVLIREGSAARNLNKLIRAVNNKNYKRFAFCTDDRHLGDLMEEGSIDNSIKLAIENGIEPIIAYMMGSFNGYQCYDIKNRGAIAPGYKADLVILSDINKVKISSVIKNGVIVTENIKNHTHHTHIDLKNTMNIDKITEDTFKIVCNGNTTNIIELIPHSLETKLITKESIVKDGCLDFGDLDDILKVGVFERHKRTGHYGLGFLKGLGIKKCTIAQTIAHDSHNIIVVGDNDKDMAKAVNALIDVGGGIVVVKDNVIMDSLTLEVAGLMTDVDPKYIAEKLKVLTEITRNLGLKEEFDPFITLSFMSLPVIPEVKLTTKGLFYYKTLKFIPLSLDEITN